MSASDVAQKYIDAWNRRGHAGIIATFAKGGAQKEAMDRFFGPDFAAAATTMVCVPDRLNPMWVSFTECWQMTDYGQGPVKCKCGQPHPEHPPYS